jgi:hypothetical protein
MTEAERVELNDAMDEAQAWVAMLAAAMCSEMTLANVSLIRLQSWLKRSQPPQTPPTPPAD